MHRLPHGPSCPRARRVTTYPYCNDIKFSLRATLSHGPTHSSLCPVSFNGSVSCLDIASGPFQPPINLNSISVILNTSYHFHNVSDREGSWLDAGGWWTFITGRVCPHMLGFSPRPLQPGYGVAFKNKASSYVNISKNKKNLGILNERWHKSKKKMGFSEGARHPSFSADSFHLAEMNAFTQFFPKQIYCLVLPLELTKTLKVLRVLKRNVLPFESERKQSEHS